MGVWVWAFGVVAGALMVTVTPVAAGATSCHYDDFTCNAWDGQRYSCPNGSSMYSRPPFASHR